MAWSQISAAVSLSTVFFAVSHGAAAQQLDSAAIIRNSDAAIRARFDHVESFTVLEHYAVYHTSDQSAPMAQMTVKTLYQKSSGKTYTILSQSGPSVIRKLVLGALLDDEKRINNPANREASWFTSANYAMSVQPGAPQPVDGRKCYAIALDPHQKAPNLIRGTMWVDAEDFSTVKIDGVATKSPSVFAGATHMMRQYVQIDGYAQASHARAVSSSMFYGRFIITIDYSNYQVEVTPAP